MEQRRVGAQRADGQGDAGAKPAVQRQQQPLQRAGLDRLRSLTSMPTSGSPTATPRNEYAALLPVTQSHGLQPQPATPPPGQEQRRREQAGKEEQRDGDAGTAVGALPVRASTSPPTVNSPPATSMNANCPSRRMGESTRAADPGRSMLGPP
jgi:hypothetical protein